MTSLVVQGNLLHIDDDSSDDDETACADFESGKQNLQEGRLLDSDDEEIETFGPNPTVKLVSNSRKFENTPNICQQAQTRTLNLVESMSKSVENVEKQNQNLSGKFLDKEISMLQASTQQYRTLGDFKENETDAFGITYQPFKKGAPTYIKAAPAVFDDEENFVSNLAILTRKPDGPSNEDDDEFDFSDVASLSKDKVDSVDILQESLNRAAITAIIPVIEESPQSFIIEDIVSDPAEVNPDETIDIYEKAKSALKEIKSIYGNGLGDVEARLLDLNLPTNPESKTLSSRIYKSSTRKSSTKSNPVTVENSSVTANMDKIEEGDEDVELEEELRHVELIEQNEIEQKKLRDEWNIINTISDDILVKKVSIYNDVEANTEIDLKISHESVFQYFSNLDLSHLSYLIETADTTRSTTSWLGSKKPTLNYPNCEKDLNFPFLVAQVDYDPSNPYHLGCLKFIYSSLIPQDKSSGASKRISCPVLGSHWERIGFQGINPQTDLNRSMKMFSVLQVVHLLDSDFSFGQVLHHLSESNNIAHKSHGRAGDTDRSWPFMCVSIMFTKEAIQALRRGDLNKKCNKRRNILSVVHDFHHACFYDFARRLRLMPKKHHAEHLKDLREYCLKDPSQLLRAYLSAIKDRKDPKNTLIELTEEQLSDIQLSGGKIGVTDDNFQNLSNSSLDIDSTNSNNNGGNMWDSLGLGGRASKFKA